jgi:hypothetical protein
MTQHSKPSVFGRGGVPTELTVHIDVLADRGTAVARASLEQTKMGYQELALATSSVRSLSNDEETLTLHAVARALRSLAGKVHDLAAAREDEAGGVDGLFDAVPVVVEYGKGGDPTAYLPDGITEADVPDGLRQIIKNLFPDNVVTYESMPSRDEVSDTEDDSVTVQDVVDHLKVDKDAH